VRTVSVRIMADASQYARTLKNAAADTRQFRAEMEKAAQAGRLDVVADQAGMLGLGLVGLAAGATKMAMDFDKQMSAVQAATHGTSKEIDQLREAAMKAGADTKYSATEAAKGVEELAKAGVSTADILGGGLSGALSLAAAGELDVGEAAETAASAMTQFKLKGADLPHVADLLAAAAGKAQGSVHDMGMALNQAGLVSAQTGLSIEETVGGLAAFASAGLLGSDAGTSFKQMLLMLQAPSGTTKKLMDQLGISAYDASGNFVGLTALAGQLREKLAGLTPEMRANAMATIFGADAVRGASILYEQGASGIQEWINKTNDAGYAAETARIKTDNLRGDLERLQGSIETLAIQSGSGANGGLRTLAQIADELVDNFTQLPPVISQSATVLAGLGGVALLAAAGWVKTRRANAEALAELRATGPAGERTARGLERVSSAAGKAAGAFIALQAAQAVVGSFQEDLNPQVDALGQGLTRWAQGAGLSGEASRLLGKDMDDLKDSFKFLADEDNGRRMAVKHMQEGFESLVPGLDGTNESLAKTKERVTAMDAALAGLVQGGSADQAKQAFEALTRELAVEGVTVDEVKKRFPQYAAALETAKTATADTKGETAGLTGSLAAAEKQAEETKKAFDALFERYMTSDQAAIEYRETLESTNKELNSGTKSLSLNTAEGRKNRGSVLDLIEAVKDQREANINNGMSLVEADKKYRAQIGTLGKTMEKMGFTRTEIGKLIGKYRDVPGKVNTSVTVTGDKAALQKLNRLSVYQQALKEGKIPLGFQGPVRGSDGKYYAEGGWTGPGEKYDEAGIVHADEHVIKKESRRKIESRHPGLLDHVNEFGDLPPGYADGGRVVWPFRTTAGMTRIPSRNEVAAKVVPEGPSGGVTAPWMEQMLEARFGLDMISGFRRGSRTLSGNLSYHARNRAVDFPPSMSMARFMYQNYKGRLKEAITPYPQYNVHNGRDHRYTGAVWRQHAFGYGNAHNHFAMARGGVIDEPILGLGASGATYSFGEGGRRETVVPGSVSTFAASSAGGGGTTVVNTTVNLNVAMPVGANPREAGRQIVEQIRPYLEAGGRLVVHGKPVLP
jgi:TP901 family phage tail tape measure protein